MKQVHKGDLPANPVTDHDDFDYEYHLMTNQNLIETVQSHSSFRPQLYKNQELYAELIKKGEQKQEKKIIKWNTNVHQKLNEEYNELQIKKEILKKNYENYQLQECSFQPSINNKSKQIGSYQASSPRYLSPKQQKMDPQKEINNQIKKCSNSNNKENNDLWNRLSKQSIRSPERIQPQSTRVSQKHTPEKLIEVTNRLYEDAFHQKKIKNQIVPQKIIKENNQQNEKYLIRYFVKQFYQSITKARLWTLENLDKQQNIIQDNFKFQVENDLCLLTYNEVAIALDHLGFLPFITYDNEVEDTTISKIYKLLQCPQDMELILSRNLLTFLIAIQGFNVDFDLVPKYNNNYGIQFPKIQQNQLFLFDQGNIQITKYENIQKQFKELYLNHLAYKKQQPQIEQKQISIKLSDQTNELANKYRQRVQSQFEKQKEELTLNDYNQFYNTKLDQLKQQEEMLIKQKCPFSPKINSTNTSPKYLEKKQIKQVQDDYVDIPTFQPQLNKQLLKIIETKPIMNQAIKRMVKGRVDKQLNQLIISQGTCYQKKRKQMEQQLYKEELNKVQPLMYVNVDLGCKQIKRITIFEGDQPRKLAEKFIRESRLDSILIDELTDLLEEQLQQ